MLTNLKRHNLVYILSSKQNYRPMTTRVLSQLFHHMRYWDNIVANVMRHTLLRLREIPSSLQRISCILIGRIFYAMV